MIRHKTDNSVSDFAFHLNEKPLKSS